MGGWAMIGQTMINVKVGGARTRVSTFLAGVFVLAQREAGDAVEMPRSETATVAGAVIKTRSATNKVRPGIVAHAVDKMLPVSPGAPARSMTTTARPQARTSAPTCRLVRRGSPPHS